MPGKRKSPLGSSRAKAANAAVKRYGKTTTTTGRSKAERPKTVSLRPTVGKKKIGFKGKVKF